MWRATAQAAQSAGTRKPARGATDGDTRWRRDQTPGTDARGAESARMPGMVGRERRGGRNAASGAGRRETSGHPVPTLGDPPPPGGLRKGEAVSVVPRPRKHRRNKERSGGRGMPSGRGLSGCVRY
ncbi:hypothetical protein [Natrialba sp. SSL1]|uniref:hypothetical protein n=1 Tax=Natrialba sp. SSL1 TaxID=1869245 RepID=UPI00149582C8|nr:hypothetical protein [Natrialba sp. SSL1]